MQKVLRGMPVKRFQSPPQQYALGGGGARTKSGILFSVTLQWCTKSDMPISKLPSSDGLLDCSNPHLPELTKVTAVVTFTGAAVMFTVNIRKLQALYVLTNVDGKSDSTCKSDGSTSNFRQLLQVRFTTIK